MRGCGGIACGSLRSRGLIRKRCCEKRRRWWPPPGRAEPFYAIIVVATLAGMLINFLGINPIQALYWTAVLNGLLAPVVLVLIANNRAVMGERGNGVALNIMGWITTLVMGAAAVALVVTWL